MIVFYFKEEKYKQETVEPLSGPTIVETIHNITYYQFLD